jgi:O-antigen/teichoic acid export membrane protein
VIIAISIRLFLKSSFWVSFAAISTRLAGLITLPFLARSLDPAGLGIYNLLSNTISSIDSLSRMGVDAAMSRNGAQYASHGKEATGRLFGVGSLLIIGAGAIAAVLTWKFQYEIANNWLGEPKIIPWMGMLSLTVIFTELSIPSWFYLIALQEFKLFSLRTTLVSLASVALTLCLTLLFGLPGAIWSLACVAFVQFIMGLMLTFPILNKYEINLRCDKFISEATSIFKFGLPFYFSNFLSSFVALPLLGYVSKSGGIEQLGYLRVAQSLSQLISFLPSAIAPVLISSLSANMLASTEEYQRLKSLHLRILWLFMLLTSTAIVFNLAWLIRLLFGPSYQEAILLAQFTIWMAMVSSLSSMMAQYMLSIGNTHKIGVIQTIGLLINVILAIFLIPSYSSAGLLIAQCISTLFITIAYIKPALMDLKPSEKKRLAFLLVFSIGIISLSFGLPLVTHDYILTLIITLICIVITTSVSLMKIFSLEEKKYFFMLLRGR